MSSCLDNEIQGIVFNIKEFAVHDGPGVRQTVFLKGCPLRCNWCHNPEGQNPFPELLVRIGSCKRCGRCLDVCAHKDGCITCGECTKVCPERVRTISGQKYTCDQLEAYLRKNEELYSRMNGGITFSGGEPLMQEAFLGNMLDRLSDCHLAIETSGYAASDVFQKIVSKCNLVIMDFKIFDDSLHKYHTGVSNECIKNNLEILKSGNIPFIIRIPVIPGVNDNTENYDSTARILLGGKLPDKVELLPYQKLAGAKYRMVGREYLPKFDANAVPRLCPEIFREYGLNCYSIT